MTRKTAVLTVLFIVGTSISFGATHETFGAAGATTLRDGLPAASTLADSELLVHLPLDEGAGTTAGDVSGQGNDGTLVNGAAFEADTGDGSPYAVRFDGGDDRIDLGTPDVAGSGLTLAAWMKADSFPAGEPRIIAKESGAARQHPIFVLSTSTGTGRGAGLRLHAEVRVNGTTTTLTADSGDLTAGVWQHAAVTYDGATVRLYLDGDEVGSAPLSGAVDVDPSMPVVVGGPPPGAGDPAFDGLLDDIRILQRALSASELGDIVAGEPPPSAPLAVDDAYAVDEDTILMVPPGSGVLANDSDPEGDPLTAALVSDVSNGVLQLNADGSFTYTPDPDFAGTDSFTYRASDGASNSNLASVSLTVNPVNDPPLAVDDAYQTGVDSALQVDATGGLLANDTDPEGDPLTAVLVTDVLSGDLSLNPDGSFEYTPTAGFSGQDGFTYRADDSALASNLATVTITVSSENSPPRIVSGAIAFTKQVIASDVDESHFAGAADFDGDSLKDVFATDYVDGMVFWYENDGAGGFVSHVLDANLEGAYPGHVGDVDLDGDMDVLAGGYLADTFVWYENEGAGSFTRHEIDTAADGAHSIVTGDLDQDGDVDLITSSQDAGVIAWYENDGGQQFTLHTIDAAALGAKRAEYADLDGDGDIDVVSASFDDDTVAWYENDGNQGFTKYIITSTANGAYYVSPADLDGDGDVDVLTASRIDDTIAWYENLGNGSFAFHAIDTNALGARTVIHADIDGDGDPDAVTASVEDDTVAWYENTGSGVFATHWVDLAADGAYGVFATDMDDDADLDVLSAHRDDNQVVLREHIRAHEAGVQVGGTLVIDSALLLTVDVDDAPVDLVYALIEAPDFGVLQVAGVQVPVGGTFTQDDIDNNRLTYVHDGGGSLLDGFEFQVQDGGEGGVGPASGTFTVIVGGTSATIVELPLDEGAGTTAGDVSGQGNDGVLVNGAAFEGDTGDGSAYSVRLDGVDDRIDLPALDVSGTGLTLAAWIKVDGAGASSEPRIISKASGAADDDHVFVLDVMKRGAALRLRARVRVNGTTTTLRASSGNLTPGVWQHAALTYDGATLRLYLDGDEVGSAPLLGAVDVDPSMPVSVGGQPPGAGGHHFYGLLDDIRILEEALSAEELGAIVSGGN